MTEKQNVNVRTVKKGFMFNIMEIIYLYKILYIVNPPPTLSLYSHLLITSQIDSFDSFFFPGISQVDSPIIFLVHNLQYKISCINHHCLD